MFPSFHYLAHITFTLATFGGTNPLPSVKIIDVHPWHAYEPPSRPRAALNCHQKQSSPANLYYILQQQINNKHTMATIEKILAQNPSPGVLADQPIIQTVEAGSDAFYALLKTSNVIGTVYMLMNYVNGTGRKNIKSIVIAKLSFRAGQFIGFLYYLVVELQDYAGPSSASPEGGTVGVA